MIMLTALDDISDRLNGLNAGADDYMSKPFVPEEVVARVNAVLRRNPHWTSGGKEKRSFGNLVIDLAAKQVLLNGAEVALTPRDLSLLFFLSDYPNRTFTRDHLIEQVWGMDYDGSDRAVDLSIKRLRQALSHWSPETEKFGRCEEWGINFGSPTETEETQTHDIHSVTLDTAIFSHFVHWLHDYCGRGTLLDSNNFH